MSDSQFRHELRDLLNRFSRESESDTPDFILADFLFGCLSAYETAALRRDAFHEPAPQVSINGDEVQRDRP